jgi:hypothetical protein
MAAAILLVSDFLFGPWVARVATAVVGGLLAWLWFAMPTVRRVADGRSVDD